MLHAGAAAAGLTLIAARHLFLLEPFDKPGQELQALNRIHRIGQAHPVTCTIYYAARTVEERLLAFRALEQSGNGHHASRKAAGRAGGDGDGEGVNSAANGGGEAEAVSVLAEGSSLPSAQKLKCASAALSRPTHYRSNSLV